MSFQEERYYTIEAYLSGELNADETTAFEDQIAADDLLKAEVEKHKVANALIMEQRLLSVKTILQEERVKDSGSNSSFKPFGFILIAAAVVGIGTSVWILNKADVTASSDKSVTSPEQIRLSERSIRKKSIAESQPSTLQDAATYNTSEDIGFHKQQIQQVEEHLQIDKKSMLPIDSSFVVKNIDVKSSVMNTTAPVPPSKETTLADPCGNVSIRASIKSSPSCDFEPTGNILVQNIIGGTKPYAVSITSDNKESFVNGALPQGTYQVRVSDAAGCIQTYSDISITGKECPIDYSFNPFYGNEEWEIASKESDRELEIYDKGGVLYFRKHIPASMSFKWNGMGTGNQILPGYYIFVMKYANGTVERGSVTIVQ